VDRAHFQRLKLECVESLSSFVFNFNLLRYIKAPKFDNKGIDFSADGKFLAMAGRRDCKDTLSIISTQSWAIAAHFNVATTDLADLKWSPDSTAIAVWDAAGVLRTRSFPPHLQPRPKICRVVLYTSDLSLGPQTRSCGRV